jgi:hypothetical protein
MQPIDLREKANHNIFDEKKSNKIEDKEVMMGE